MNQQHYQYPLPPGVKNILQRNPNTAAVIRIMLDSIDGVTSTDIHSQIDIQNNELLSIMKLLKSKNIIQNHKVRRNYVCSLWRVNPLFKTNLSFFINSVGVSD